MRIVSISVLPLMFAVISCGSDSPVNSLDGIMTKNSKVSFCGGFEASIKSVPRTKTVSAASDTTTGETFTWSYDKASRTASFLDERVNLNCCGTRTIAAYPENNRLVIAESDSPGTQGRCKCMCDYDFSTEIGGLSPGRVEVVLQITIDGVLTKKWAGTIDLSKGSGTLAIPMPD